MFKYLGVFLILMISFFYTEKTALIVKDIDSIMLQIKERKAEIDKAPIEAIIKDNTIIPGISGYEVEINKSYQKMRYIGKYNDAYLEYKKVLPKETLANNIDKVIISGNSTKKDVAILLVLKNEKYLSFIKKVGDNINIFIDASVLENNQDKLRYQSNIIGTIGYNYNYDNLSISWIDNMIKSIANKETSYCLINSINQKSNCSKYNSFTIYSEQIKTNPLFYTRKKLQEGKILVYEINNSLLNELDSIVNFITSKGYTIVKLDELLKE